MEKITFTYLSNLCVIYLNGETYAVIQDCRRDEISESEVTNWVLETYYDDSYLCDQYLVPNLRKKDFAV